MTRALIALAVLLVIAGGGIWIGRTWDATEEKQDEIDTLKEIRDATTDERTAADIDERLRQLAGE